MACVRYALRVTQQTQNICMTFVQRWSNTWYLNVLCLHTDIASEFALNRQEIWVSLWYLILKCCGLLLSSTPFYRVILSEAVDGCRLFALPEKYNMAVTESDPDTKVRKMSTTF